MEIEKLKLYAKKLMFDMEESEYKTLQEEFDITLKQMELLEKIKNIKEVEPMTFPFINEDSHLREDNVGATLTKEEIMQNVKVQERNQVKVPKVVE